MTYEYVKPDIYVPPSDAPWLVICDIDGTISHNNGHRDFFEYKKVADDELIVPIAHLVHVLTDEFAYGSTVKVNVPALLFMSGREDTCYYQTADWLERTGGFTAPWLVMRKEGDHRPDWVVKLELFGEHVRGRFRVQFAIDDRNQVVRLWRDLGLTCLQVADGDF